MSTSFARDFPAVPPHRWHARLVGQTGDPDDRTAKAYYLIDATSAPEAELRVLAWIHHDYENDLQYAVASADPVELEASHWRVEVEWDARPRT